MSFRRFGTRVRNIAERRQDRQRTQKRLQTRQNLVQQLEDRRLLAGPELVAIRPDAGALLNEGDTLNVAPLEFNLQFRAGANLDESTINSQSVKLVRSGGDGTFGDGNEIDVALGYVGLENPGFTDPANLQRIVFRTASSASHNATDPTFAFPDDLYQIQVFGSGPNTLTNLSNEAFNDGNNLTTTFRLDRGAQVVAVVPQPISHSPLTQASDEIDVYFDDQPLDPTQVVDPAYYRLVNTAASLSAADDSILLPESVTYDATANKVTLKFESAIPEGTFRLDVGQSGGDNSVLSGAIRIGSLNDSNRLSENGFLGDLGGVSDNAADVDLYSVTLGAGSTLQATVVPQAASLNLTVRLLDAAGAELVSVNSGPDATNVLNFPITAAAEYFIEITSADGSTGSYALDAGVIGSPVSTNDNNSSFSTGTDLGTLGAADVRLTSSIRRQVIPLPPRAGSEDEPGHRQIQREAHIGARGTTPTTPANIRVVNYYFPGTLGTDTNGDTYPNLITAKEKQIVREIFEIYAQLSGYEFQESSATTPGGDDLMIGKGDFRAVSPTLGPNDGVAGLANGSFAILNGSIYNQSNRFFGDGFTTVMFHEIGHSLGLGHSYDIPSNQGTGVPNDVLPGDHDVVHLQRIVPPNSTDIDMYNFTLTERGRLNAETVAERLATPSLLNTSITLYRQVNGVWELVARNDQYYGSDSFLDLQLEPGTYSIGVSSTGNTNYDPRVPDSGFGGTTDGAYDLKLSFQADQDGAMLDATGTPIDGDADGRPGGLYSFWFQSTDPAATIYVDKSTDTTAGPEGSGTLANPYDTIDFALQQAGDRIVVPVDGHNSISVGEGFVIDDGINVATFRFGTAGVNPVDLSGAASPADVALAIQTAVNNAKTAGRLIGSVSVNVSDRIVQLSGIDNLNITASPTLLATPNLVRILANGGLDQDIASVTDNRPYLVGLDTSGNPLADGAEFLVPQGVNVMIEAGALLKLRRANLDAGSSSANISRSHSSIQVLGTPELSVLFRSYHNDSAGGDSDGVGPVSSSGDFGGIVFRGDSDLDSEGVFLNYVNHADINNGGGDVFVDANELPFAPIYVTDARPTLSFNRITSAKGPAISASPDSFDDSRGRIGPDVDGNFLADNEINGLFIRVKTPLGSTIDKLDVSGRFDDTDITHVLSENLIISGAAGGPLKTSSGTLVARAAGRLVVDPGLVLKLDLARVEVERGAGALIAEGTENRPVIFTSTADDRFGGSGAFNTDDSGNPLPLPGDWGGLFFGQSTSGSIDNALVAYGGGSTPIEGGAANFNAIEIHQADVRIANSVIDSNAGGAGGGQRNGRGAHQAAAIYVRAAQPIIVDNTIINNGGPAININANAMRFETRRDTGRTTGPADRYSQFDDNTGPLVRLNRLDDNSVNGMQVRGEFLTTETIWDDTDIVHVLSGEVVVGNLHTYNGLTLKSSNAESLVIKAASGGGGFTATGSSQEIIDRVGGTIHVLGTPGHPVVLTSLSDDSVGAGFTPSGDLSSNTNNSVNPSAGTPGDWRGLLFDEWSNDRNVLVVRELENPLTNGNDTNRNTVVAQNLGVLAPDQKSGDENRRLGFAVNGLISPTNADDVDVYSFTGTAGTEVWIDIDRTNTNLDAIIEVVNASGTVLARSVRSGTADPGNLNADTLTKNPLLGGDHYTQNFRDPGMRYVLPGTVGQPGTYFVRVRSNPATAGNINVLAGESRGEYQLQIRLDQVQEFPGSIVKFADIRYAATGIDVRGLPAHSPLIGEAGELPAANDTFGSAQTLVNLLETDVAALGISGNLSSGTDADWYEFELTQTGVQLIAGVNDGAGTIAVVLDIDYSDKAVRADTTIAVFDQDQNLVYLGGESNIIDDQPVGATGSIDDLSRGSLGNKDAYIGPIHLTPGTESDPKRYYVAVMSDRQVPSALTGVFQAAPANSANGLVRLEPVNSVSRIVEDHLGYQGYSSRGGVIAPETPQGLFDLSSTTAVDINVKPFSLKDVALYVGTDRVEDNNNLGNNDHLYTVDPYESSRWLTRVTNDNGINGGVNDVQDIVIRTDGRMFGYQRLNGDTNSVGALVEFNPETGNITLVGNDNIADRTPTPNAGSYPNNIEDAVSRDRRANQFTTSDEVDALTFRRTGTTGPAAAPVPEYDVYYSVRESDNASKLYLGRENGDASLDPDDPYGFRGYIQPAGVTFTERLIRVGQPVTDNPPNITTIRLKSKIAGTAGDFTINFTARPNNTNATVTVTGNVINLSIGGTGGPPVTGAPSAAAIANAINNHAQASQLVTAVIYGGNANNDNDGADGTPAIFFSESLVVAGSDGADGPLLGRVTGLSFGNFYGTGNLYGVTNAGEFLVINPNNGVVTQRINTTDAIGVADLDFQGLSLGPQNVEGGAYANVLFAVTGDGQIVAFDVNGNGVFAFESGNASQVVTTDSDATGGYFTLTTDVGGFGRQTTDPIAVNAPSVVSLNEIQSVRSVGAGAGGTFTLSLVDDVGAVTSPSAVLDGIQNTFTVQDASDFPAAPFTIRVELEEMRVNTVVGNQFQVTRGINGTAASAHTDTSSVLEVRTAKLSGGLSVTAASTIATAIDDTTTTVSVLNATGFPATPFTIRVENEEMLVNMVVGNDLTVVRAQNGTSAEHHSVTQTVRVISDSLTLVDASALPAAAGFNLRINNEDLRVVGVTGNTFDVIRGANGTGVTFHFAGDTVSKLDTTATLPFDATNVEIAIALGALPSVGGAANVLVSGGQLTGEFVSTPLTIEFVGPLASKNFQLLTGDSSNLVGDELQEISLDPNVNGGTFQLRFNGQTTTDLNWNATAAEVEAALKALGGVGPADVVVSGSDLGAGPLTVQFTGDLQDQNVTTLLAPVAAENLLQNEIQSVAITGAPTGGDFTLSINDPANGITAGISLAIPWNADATAVQNAIVGNITELAGNISVTGTPFPGGTMFIEFTNAFANTDMAQFTFATALTGGTTPTVVVNTTQTIDAPGPIITETRRGVPVSVPVVGSADGVLSVLDSLLDLSSFNAGDVSAAGILAPPGNGVSVSFIGAYSGVAVPLLEVDNFLNVLASEASVVARSAPGAGTPGSFIMDVSGMNVGAANPIGLAFSPLDFNLWHPTTLRSNDAGHGINEADDDTRVPTDTDVNYNTPGSSRTFNQGQGGVSYQFGLEQWVLNQNSGSQHYLNYLPGVNAQYGILNTDFHADLSSNPAIVGNFGNGVQGSYNLPAGALGTLTTKTFDLANTVNSDRPTLYFSYFLETEGHNGSNLDSDDNDPFRDSARVFISNDGGATWNLVASNNSQLSAADPTDGPGTAELPGFLSRLSDAGLNSATPRAESQQIVQELFDNTGQWRQARVDLSTYAGQTGLMLRVDFSSAGAINDSTLGRIDTEYDTANATDVAEFGEYVSTTSNARSIRSLDNQHQGFFVDDFIIGYAERGEMVTGDSGDSTITNLFANTRTQDRDPNQFPDIVNGPYQLEIRRTDEYVVLTSEGPVVGAIFDTNDRHIDTATETASLSFEPASFVPSLVPTDTTILGGFTAAEIEPWSVTANNPNTGVGSLESGAMGANRVSIFEVQRSALTTATEVAGIIRFSYSVSSALDTHGLRFYIDGVPQTLVPELTGAPVPDRTLASGVLDYQTVEFTFGSGDPVFTWAYDFTDTSPAAGDNRAFIDNVQVLQGGTGLLADRNRERAQGILVLDSNFVTDSAGFGINVQPGAAEAGGSVPHPGSTINFPQLNTQRLVPGVVIQNNVIAGSSGIRFAGETGANPQRPVPFGRLVNNTLVGGDRTGTGIDIVGLASPTILNNLINDFNLGINNGGTGTVIRSNFFQDNAGNGSVGSASIVAPNAAALFVDSATGNYYLVDTTTAINSSQNTEQDRLNYLTFKTELGIPASPINAPSRDVFGQLRVDPNASALGDRGAVEDTDADAPYATLLNPIDNDAEGNDRDPSDTVVLVTNALLENFTILLGDGRDPNSPFEGTGVNGLTVDDPSDDTVSDRAITIEQNGVALVQGVDYIVGYNELSGVLRLTPLGTLWEASSVYVISLDNGLIADRAGNLLRSNQTNGETRFTIIIPDVGIDFGDAPDTYRTLLPSNGARHTINETDNPTLGLSIDGEEDGQPTVGADGDNLTGGDEDGLTVGSFMGTTTTEGLFLTQSAPDPTADPNEVVAFLNRNDVAGAILPLTVTGSGILDVWVDFNGDGDFADFGEKAVSGLAVTDGDNAVRVITPATATTGLTYARFRLSEDGSFEPYGLALGGEVEDYRVNIVHVDTPTLVADSYTVNEDEILVVDGSVGSQPTLFANDTLPGQEYVVSHYIIDAPLVAGSTDTYRLPNGTVRIDDAATGHFTYTPDSDYYGPDSFRYRVSTQRNDGPEADAAAVYETVNIVVAPINDAPLAQDASLVALESQPGQVPADQPQEFLSSTLLAGAIADADIMIPASPWDESNQISSLRVISLTVDGVTLDPSVADPIAMTASATTPLGGTITAYFVTEPADALDPTTFERTVISKVTYQGADYFNGDNVRGVSDPRLLDSFSFTIQDDGRSLDLNGNPVAGTPLTDEADATVLVTPQNSEPVLASENVAVSDTRYNDYYVNQNLMVPVPTEDNQLTIPSAYLLSNDFAGPDVASGLYSAADENQGIGNNDGALRIISVSMDPAFGTLVLDSSSGDILFTPADDLYGAVEFSYVVEDQGVDEALDGTRTLAPLTATTTATIFVQPVNDAPVAYDRALSVDEAIEPAGPAILNFTAADLLDGVGTVANTPIGTTSNSITVVDGAAMIDGQTVVITNTDGQPSVVEFSTTATPSIGTDVLVTYAGTDLAGEIAANLAAQLTAAGLGGVVSGGTVTMPVVTAVATATYTSAASVSATGLSVPDGAMIVGGEVIRLTDANGQITTVELSTSGNSITGADVVATFSLTDDAATVAASIKAALSGVGIGSYNDPTPLPGRAGLLINGTTVTTLNDPATQITESGDSITLPDGLGLIDGETVTIDDGRGGSLIVEFNTTGVLTAGSDLVVQYSTAEFATAIATELVSVLRAAELGALDNGDGSVSLRTVAAGASIAPLSFFAVSPTAVVVPAADQLIDGETLTLTVGGSNVVVEFNTSGVASPGSDYVITFIGNEPATSLVTTLENTLRADGYAVTADGDTLRLSNSSSVGVEELPAVPGDFDVHLAAPFNEQEQALRVIAFATSEGSFTVSAGFTGAMTLDTATGGLLTYDFVNGAFTSGTYQPALDYNGLTPFPATELFTYGISDDGQTTLPVAGTTLTLGEEVSVQQATVTISVRPANDHPFIVNVDEVDVPEDPPGGQATLSGVFTTVLPGPTTAQDEQVSQARPTVTNIQATDPDGVMAQLPVVTSTGGLTVFPNVDAVGQVIYVFTFTDDDPTDPKSTDVTVTVNVRPVNDPPRFDPNVTGTTDSNGPDDIYQVAEVTDPVTGEIIDGTITYTLREDNSQPVGQPDAPYFIPLRRDPGVSGYTRVGLLDVFTVGPANESDPTTAGGNQTLSLDQIPTRSDLGGTLTLGVDSFGNPGVFYVPPVNYNQDIGGVDSFTYTVIDDGTTVIGGVESPDPQTAINSVELVLTPVNDRPQFNVNLLPIDFNDPNSPLQIIETVEDSDLTTLDNFAFSIEPAPPTTAFDEVNVLTGQSVQFSVTPLSFAPGQSSDFFSVFPSITPEGTLSFKPEANVFGSFDFEVVLVDNGDNDQSRGDLNTSLPVTVTIDVLPINDAPVVRTDVDPLSFTINEDTSLDVFSNGVGNDRGLLDVFAVGPANEGMDLTPGGNQSVFLKEPTPVQTAFGGTITQIRDNGVLIGLRYTPRTNFVGTDSFIYTVTDNGTTVDFGTDGAERSDPRIASNTVSINVSPVNNPPQYSGPANVTVIEDAGAVTIDNWATNVLAGPQTALDELASQDLFFTVTQLTGDPNLFASAPIAVIDANDKSAQLQFEPAGNANGIATFEVQLFDVPTDGTQQQSTAPRTFTLRVNAVNDPPTFDPVTDSLTVLEDSGPYSNVWATNISPGPSDEVDAGQTVRFQVVTPVGAQGLFQQLPEIADDGVLRFIPAANANGSVDLTVTAIDSLGGTSVQELLRLDITAVNDQPVAVADNVATDEDSVLTIDASQLLANDIDPDINNPGDTLTVVMNADGFSLTGARVTYDQATGQITYDPSTSIALQALSQSDAAVDSFTYRVVDSQGVQSNVVTVAVAVDGINDAPTAVPDNPTLNPNGPTIIEVLANDSDVDGDIIPTSIEITLQPAFGSLSIDNQGVITFTAFQSFALEDVFRYRVADETGAYSAEALVTIEANAAPVARDDQAGTYLDETISINVVANDFDPDPEPGAPNGGLVYSSIKIVDAPLSGEAVPLGDGNIRYIPGDGFLGIDSFTYTIEDSAGRVSSPANVQVQVVGSRLQNPNLNPDVNDDGDISPIDALLVINRLARAGTGSVPVEDSDVGPPYYDVNGDQQISPSDALAVINELARRQASSGQGEGELTVLDEISTDMSSPVSGDFLGFIDLIATNRDDDDDDDERLSALDIAFGDLL